MHDTSTSIDRLAKIISDKPKYNPDYKNATPPPKLRREIHIGVAEGWFSLVLLAIVVYSTVWCVQAAGWVDHLNILTLTTALGLTIGVVASKQKSLPPLVMHIVALGFGLLLSFWQTAGSFYYGNTGTLTAVIQHWLSSAFIGVTGNDDAIFLFFILSLGFVLAYTSAWLVYRTRNPWLMIVANAIILLINLSSVDSGYIIFLVVFLMASLLLLLRFNLYESMRRWHRQGLRYPDDIGWDVMQAGAILSVGILIFSWLLPGTYTNDTAAQIWNSSSNPWQQAESTWNRIISLNGGPNPSNHGNFRDSLTLGGNPNLNHDTVLTFTVQGTNANGPVYLATLNYDTYLKSRSTWTNGSTETVPLKANDPYPSDGFIMTHMITEKVTVVSPLNEQYSYVLGASDVTAYNAPANILRSKASGSVVAWLGQNAGFSAGAHYTIVSTISSADVQTLRGVPLPANAPHAAPVQYDGPPDPNVYNSSIVSTYTSLPDGLDPRILEKAKHIIADAHATTMYDKAVALESFFRSNYSYSTNIQLPSGKEGVSWFLFDNTDYKGFCNYFSTSMVVMARELGIPARVVAGYTNGTYDAKTHQYVVHGTDAHSWVQVYFAGYGWVNFEPSQSFATFTRPLPNQFSVSGKNGGTNGANGGGVVGQPNQHGRTQRNGLDDSSSANSSAATTQVQLRQQVGTALGSVVLLILFGALLFLLWWRRLFRRYSLSTQFYGRLCLLANWAGIRLQPSQTPYEYIHGVASASAPQDTLILERLGDIYVRDKWADPESSEHPLRSGEIHELPSLWRRIQPHLFLHVLRHPSFLRWIPQRIGAYIITLRRRRWARKAFEEEV
ncbi:MAG: hypothetical protein NVSMB54_01740 [Ktedonobacteraceae bacterium]